MQLETVLLNREVCKLKNLEVHRYGIHGFLQIKRLVRIYEHIREYVSFSVGVRQADMQPIETCARFPNHLLDIVSVFPSLKFTACPQSVAYVRSYIFVDDICLNSDNLTHQIGMTKNRSNIRFLTAGDKQMNFRGGKLCNASDPIEQILSGNDELIKSVEYETNLTISDRRVRLPSLSATASSRRENRRRSIAGSDLME
ncbi:hypothetical protein KCU94_g30, partial [Aureobasidium melanogenum]